MGKIPVCILDWKPKNPGALAVVIHTLGPMLCIVSKLSGRFTILAMLQAIAGFEFDGISYAPLV
jgi:hypothetical protein